MKLDRLGRIPIDDVHPGSQYCPPLAVQSEEVSADIVGLLEERERRLARLARIPLTAAANPAPAPNGPRDEVRQKTDDHASRQKEAET